jgi:3-phenylpropionate/trans-cinnamate dioxygenase ferredoxin reductase subunit
MADERTFVIVGASLTGAKAAETLRSEGFTGRIVLVGQESDLPYERPPLSKGYLMGKEPRVNAYVHKAQWYPDNNVELVLGTRVTRLDPKAHTVTLDDVGPLRYDRLLLATGSRVRRLDLPGSDNLGVRYLRTIAESDAILSDLQEGANVVVLGAGWIGLEVAAAARTRGALVHLVERGDLPLKRVLGTEVARIYANLHEARGVIFHSQSGIREFGGVGGRLSHVILADGSELPADLVVVGVGIAPATELAEAAGLQVDDGVVTDESLRTSDPDIFAAGDVASFVSPPVGQRIRVEHWANALNGGKSVAKSMLGQAMVYDWLPYFYSDQYEGTPSISMEYAGFVGPDGYDQVVFRGDTSIRADANPEFVAFWVRDGRVLAGMNANVPDVQEQIQALVRAGYSGRSVDLAKLADPDVPLADLVTPLSRS